MYIQLELTHSKFKNRSKAVNNDRPSLVWVYGNTWWNWHIFPKQCLHLGVLTSGGWPFGRGEGYLYRYLYGTNVKNHYTFTVFYNMSARNKGKPTFSSMFSKVMQKAQVLWCFCTPSAKKQRGTNGFSVLSTKCCKKTQVLYFLQYEFKKNQKNRLFFNIVSKMLQKKT